MFAHNRLHVGRSYSLPVSLVGQAVCGPIGLLHRHPNDRTLKVGADFIEERIGGKIDPHGYEDDPIDP
jgi:hypothetical protein